ncbi:hypothetical protein DID73_01565 [Candidatus Marinamargulisbacteria bacterium SCGC AG-343-K17]|nr:hypothetical protein DID73_01565 [Candidatus Marinamargulisbacteria bacterium SCGC AG-343-K17]
MMFDKYFGFLRSHDEESIIQSLLEHSKIDSEELHILSKMLFVLMHQESGDLDSMHSQINQINDENVKIFETVSDHIIQSNFDFQKQYDLLRLQQRIDSVSGLIIATSKRIIITKNIGAEVPNDLFPFLKKLSNLVIESQETFIEAIQKFQTSRKEVIKLIHKVEEQENLVDNTRSESLEVLYHLANQNQLKMGDLASIEGIIEYYEDISDAIKAATTSLDWLLLN